MRKWSALAVSWSVGVPLGALGADVELAGDVGVGYSDNIARTAASTRDETIGSIGMQLSAKEDTRRLAMDIGADLAYQYYFRNTYDAEIIGSIDGAAVLRIVPERLHWTVEDHFGQTRLDLFSPVTPENRENINRFSTGPDLLLPLGNQNEARLAGRYGRVDYEDSLLDSERYGGELALMRRLSGRSSMSLNGVVDRVDFADEPPNVDFDIQSAYVRYEAEGARTLVTVDAGANRLDRSGTSDDSPLVRLDVTRLLGREATLRLEIGTQLTDAGGTAGTDQDIYIGEGTQALATTSEPFTLEYATLGWDATGRRTRVGLSASYSSESYDESVELNRDRLEGQAYVARDFGPGWTIRLTGTYRQEDFRNQPGDSDETTGVLGISRQVANRLRIDVSAERSRRNSETGLGEFSENRVWLRLRMGEELARSAGLPTALPRERSIASPEL